MSIEFEYTFDDLKEAHAAHQPKVRKGQRALATVVLVIVVAGFLFLAVLAQIARPAQNRHALLDFVMPVVALVVFLAPWLAYRSFKTAGWRGAWRSRGIVGTIGWVVFVLLLLLLWRLFRKMPAPAIAAGSDAPPPAPGASISDILLPHATWLLLLGVFCILLIRQVTGQLRMIWEGSPGLHRRYTMTADDQGIAFAEPLARHELQWFAFDRVIETRNLYLLYIADHSFHMVPKRAFADDAQSDEFRAMIDNRITRRAAAFPVLPVGG